MFLLSKHKQHGLIKSDDNNNDNNNNNIITVSVAQLSMSDSPRLFSPHLLNISIHAERQTKIYFKLFKPNHICFLNTCRIKG